MARKIGLSVFALAGAVLLYFFLPGVLVVLTYIIGQLDIGLAQVFLLLGGLAASIVPYLAFGWWMYRIWLQEPRVSPDEPEEDEDE
jgi:hypothetical protein